MYGNTEHAEVDDFKPERLVIRWKFWQNQVKELKTKVR